MNILITGGAVVAAIATISGATWTINSTFATKEEVKQEIMLSENNTGEYMLELRIDIYEQRVDSLLDKNKRRDLTSRESRDLKRYQDALKKLYEVKDTQ